MTLGRYPSMTLAEARQLHGAAMQEVELHRGWRVYGFAARHYQKVTEDTAQ